MSGLASTSGADLERLAHGGDIDRARQRYPGAPQPWIDLSTGINPQAYPVPAIAAETWQRLPTAAEEAELCRIAAARYGVADPAMVVAAPGTQALIQMVPRLLPPSRVAVLGPTYQEHAACWRRAGHEVEMVASATALAGAGAGADVVVVVNPDNPTGRILPVPQLREIAADLARRDGLLVVDEAFADVLAPAVSLAADLPSATIVLRSFGKAYGLAGLRLGFALAQPGIASRVRAELGPWAVAGPALAIGRAALADAAWLAATVARLGAETRRLDDLLVGTGATILGGTPLFRTAVHPAAAAVADRLGRQGIHVRTFSYAPDWLRLGIPGSPAAWDRLAQALTVRSPAG